MTTRRAKLDIDLDLLNGYIYAGQLQYINGEWRWEKDGFANDIVFIEPKSRGWSSGVSLKQYLQSQGDLIHNLTYLP
jgi:hypothetical protein